VSSRPIYDWFGGFGEFCTIASLTALFALAATNHLTEGFALAITAIGGSGIAHDQLTQWQDDKKAEAATTKAGATVASIKSEILKHL
jgi:hypothetical protein